VFERYHVPLKTVACKAAPIPKFVITRADNCVNCGKCEKACIYGVHKRSEQDPRKMADPINDLCKNCFRCIQECPQRSLSMSPGPEYRALGRGVWTSLRMLTIYGEAETGKIPVLGAGYRGPFAGPGYDGMWTDMSEIVRPTRDGIHGREYISTSVDIGRKPGYLKFGGDGKPTTALPPIVELPIPMVLDVTRMRVVSPSLQEGFANAALSLGSLLFVKAGTMMPDALIGKTSQFVTVYPEGTDVESLNLPEDARVAELSYSDDWRKDARAFRTRFPKTVLSFRISAAKGVEQKVAEMASGGVGVVHVLYDEEGRELGNGERHSKDSLKAIHRAMVAKSIRDEITIIAGGGIAAAEHVPKTVICGADVIALERALMIALECRNHNTCSEGSCPINVKCASPGWVEARVENLVGAWRDQLLEVLGAMGLREVRRLRGELGRAIFYEDVEREAFSEIEGGAADGPAR
jgi:NAD-dependent dihydropyrimidine dehydrogenase PreA subunit